MRTEQDHVPRGVPHRRRSWTVRPVLEPTERRRLAGLLADAFLDDPMQRWLFPNERRRRGRLLRFYDLDIAHRLERRSDVVVDGTDAVAFWHPPGDERTVPVGAALRLAPAFSSVAGHHPIAALRVLRAVEARRPRRPHWYLSHLAVQPLAQGRGIGGRLLAAGLDRAAADGVGVYLETANPANRRFYRRHGLDEAGTIEVPGAPPVWVFERCL